MHDEFLYLKTWDVTVYFKQEVLVENGCTGLSSFYALVPLLSFSMVFLARNFIVKEESDKEILYLPCFLF
jgi:hypothetical protein